MLFALQMAPASRIEAPTASEPPDILVLRTREAIEAAAPEWAALEQSLGGAILFQSVGWCRAVLDHRLSVDPSTDPVVVTLRRGGELRGVLPLERLRGSGGVRLAPLGDGFAQYSDVLLAPDLLPQEVVPAMLDAAVAQTRADLVRLPKTRADSTLRRGLPEGTVGLGGGGAAPFVALGAHADFEEYQATVRLKTRKNMRHARNRLERLAPVTHRIAATAEETRLVITRTVAGRAGRLEAQGLTSSAFRDASFHAFCRSLAGRSDLEILAMSLLHGGEPVAEQWGFVHCGRYYCFVTSRDFTMGPESPGKLHLKEVIETAFGRGLSVVDLMAPAMPYKLTWASGTVPVEDYAVPVTLSGQAWVHLWHRMIRPLAKRAYLSLPPAARTRIMAAMQPAAE